MELGERSESEGTLIDRGRGEDVSAYSMEQVDCEGHR